ncbi:hypothetical protein MLPF_2520 [Mycobacterium lepromatosis]|nr:hypothetical protein MLPF_2520 [Mycobacterium lepromatosis]
MVATGSHVTVPAILDVDLSHVHTGPRLRHLPGKVTSDPDSQRLSVVCDGCVPLPFE